MLPIWKWLIIIFINSILKVYELSRIGRAISADLSKIGLFMCCIFSLNRDGWTRRGLEINDFESDLTLLRTFFAESSTSDSSWLAVFSTEELSTRICLRLIFYCHYWLRSIAPQLQIFSSDHSCVVYTPFKSSLTPSMCVVPRDIVH